MPNSLDYQFSVPLTNWVRNYKLEAQTMAQDIVAPVVARKNGKGSYHTLGLEMFARDTDDTLGTNAEPHELHYDVGSGTFATKEYGAMIFVSNKEKAEALSPWDPMRQAALTVRHFLRLKKETRLVTLAAATSNTAAASFAWDDDDNAVIVSDVQGAKAALYTALGWSATHFLFGQHIADEIVGQADIIDLIKYAAAMSKPTAILNSLSSDDLPPRIMGMKTVIPQAQYNTISPGLTAVYANVWGSDAYLFHLDPSSQSPTWAKTFESLGMSIKTVPDAKRGAHGGSFVIGTWEYEVKEVTAASCYRISAVT